MIDKKHVQTLVNEVAADLDLFVVEIVIDAANNISVLVDSEEGVKIDDCVKISRNVEHNLDREAEDFKLHVSSAGLDLPFKILRQYQKNIGKEVEVITPEGLKITGKLLKVDENQIEVEEIKNVKLEGKKRKELVAENRIIEFDNIKTTKAVISFK